MLRAFAIWISLGACGFAGEKIHVLAEDVTLPHAVAVELVRGSLGAANANALRAAVQEQIDAGTAKLRASTLLLVDPSSRVSIGGGSGRMFPIQWECSDIVRQIHGTIIGNPKLTTGAMPTNFESRQLGIAFGVDVATRDGVVDLSLSYSNTRHLGTAAIGEREGRTDHPRIYREEISSSLSAASGDYSLAGMTKPAAGDGVRSLLFVKATVRGAEADTKRGDTASNLRILTEHVEVSVLDSVRLLSDIDRFRKGLDTLFDEGKARRVESSFIATRSGGRAKVESQEELLFPSEIGCPPEVPFEITGKISTEVRLQSSQGYSSYEMRGIGVETELDAMIGTDRVTIDLNILTEVAELLGWKKFRQVPQPVIGLMQNSTAATVWSGESILLGMHVPVDSETGRRDESKRVLVVVTAAVNEEVRR